jgi:hypothetical protein
LSHQAQEGESGHVGEGRVTMMNGRQIKFTARVLIVGEAMSFALCSGHRTHHCANDCLRLCTKNSLLPLSENPAWVWFPSVVVGHWLFHEDA